jgi:starch synthase
LISKKVLLTHPGTQHSMKLAEQLLRKDILLKYVTGFKLYDASITSKLINMFLPIISKKYFVNRIINISPSLLRTYPSYDVLVKILSIIIKSLNDLYFFSNGYFQYRVSYDLINKSDFVIGFDTSSWILSKRTKKENKKFILDISIAHSVEMQKTINYLNKKYPEWAASIPFKKQKYLDFENAELNNADVIVSASSFAKKTLIKHGIPDKKIFLNPYGVDINRFQFNNKRDFTAKLKFVFIGSVTARKGVPLLVYAWQKLNPKNAELLIIGPIGDKERKLIPIMESIKVLGKIPNDSLAEIIIDCHIFIFPSYFEGFGLVILEAMASGLVVITTDATAGPDIIENGKEGFVYNTYDEDKLIEFMQLCMDDRELLKNISNAARKKAESFTWDAYGDRYYNIINNLD